MNVYALNRLLKTLDGRELVLVRTSPTSVYSDFTPEDGMNRLPLTIDTVTLRRRVVTLNYSICVTEDVVEDMSPKMQEQAEEDIWMLLQEGRFKPFLDALKAAYVECENEGERRMRAERHADNIAYNARRTSYQLEESARRSEWKRIIHRLRSGD